MTNFVPNVPHVPNVPNVPHANNVPAQHSPWGAATSGGGAKSAMLGPLGKIFF